ncbi:MAG: hypothetical protein U0556_12840 [Dehalococcoidia bacterium]
MPCSTTPVGPGSGFRSGLFVAYQWITSGWGKFAQPGLMDTGAASVGFWVNALMTDPRPVITYDWYRAFIQTMVDLQA